MCIVFSLLSDNFLYDFEGSIIEELEMKTNYLKF